jgi:alkylhydroperoxidase/carboxymuconolactone decarboxylase family protein YurZ
VQQHKTWVSIVVVLVVGISLGLAGSIVGAGQGRGGATTTATDGDGGYQEHMVPGDPWLFEAWPSHRQREYQKQLANYDPPLYAAWKKRMDQAIANKKLDKHTELVIVSAMDAMVHWIGPVTEQHIDQAFDAGSNISELFEAMQTGPETSTHSIQDGVGALVHVVAVREKAGKPVPLRGAPLTEKDLIPSSSTNPPVFKWHVPMPRTFQAAKDRWQPEIAAIDRRAGAEKAKLPKALSGRMTELITSASDSIIRYPDPLLDHHMHEALNRGSNVQEILEVVMVTAESVQGASESNVQGRRVHSGVEILHHGVSALGRVIAERDKAGYKTPGEYGEGFTKKMY